MALCRSCEKREARVTGLCGLCAARELRSHQDPGPRRSFERKEPKTVVQRQ